MRYSPPPLSQAFPWRRHVWAGLALLLIGGCGTPNGDFGEVRPTLVRDGIHDWVGPYASADYASDFPLTDDERALRDLGYPLIEAPYNRQQWYSVVGEYGLIRPGRGAAFDRSAYANYLMARRDRSPSARYARLDDDVRNDITRAPQFFEAASRVLDIDRKRRRSMAVISAVSSAERSDADRRMRENAAIVALVREKLGQREASYRFALERLVIASPSAQAAELERVINQLHATIARYRHLPPSWVREQSLATAR